MSVGVLKQPPCQDCGRELPEYPFKGQLNPAGGRQNNHADVDDLEDGDEKQGTNRTGTGDIRLMKPDLPCPATDMEGKGHSDEEVDGGEEHGVTGRKPPREQDQRENGDAVGGQGDGHVAEPAVAEIDMAVLVVDVEPVYLPEEEASEDQVCEFVGEGHHPAGVVPHARNQIEDEERGESYGKISVEFDPSNRYGLELDSPYENAYGQQEGRSQKNGIQNAEHVSGVFQGFLTFGVHDTKIPIVLISSKNLFTFGKKQNLSLHDRQRTHPGYPG